MYLVPLMIKVAKKLNLMDTPDGKLKKHVVSTPYLGGLAVYLGFIISLCLTFPFENQLFLFLIGSTLLLFVGLIDDCIVMEPYQKLIGQIVATFCFLKAGVHLKTLFFSYLPNVLISFFWMLSVINAFNLVDVMDGLSITLAIMASFSFLLCALFFQNSTVALLLSSFLGALVAFFWFNKPLAKIYLGDAGSLFIGGFLATIPFMLPWGLYSATGYLAPVIILFIPFLEVGTLIIIRLYKGIAIYQGSPDHFSMYLRDNGWKTTYILIYVALLSLILLAIALSAIMDFLNFFSLMVCSFLFLIGWYWVIIGKNSQKWSKIFPF